MKCSEKKKKLCKKKGKICNTKTGRCNKVKVPKKKCPDKKKQLCKKKGKIIGFQSLIYSKIYSNNFIMFVPITFSRRKTVKCN